MARGITENEVWKACDALLLEGARPTIERVRQKLGRGSPNTVSPMLESWFKHLGGRISDPGAFSAPSTVPEPVHQAAQHFWEVAQAEARRDLDDRVRDGLAAAASNVEAEKERAVVAEAAAFSAVHKATHLQAELDQLRGTLESERATHAATTARLDTSGLRCSELQAELTLAREAIDEARSCADAAVAAANERAAGAERRAAMELERERMQRNKAEKSTELIARRFEEALKAQISATEQLRAVEGRLDQYKAGATQREQELRAEVDRGGLRLSELEAALQEARRELSGRAAQDAFISQLMAKLGPAAVPVAIGSPATARRTSKARREG